MQFASGPWGLMRADWPDHPDVGVDEIAVLSVLSLYTGRDGTCYPSQKTLAARLKRSRGWVIGVLNRLATLGLVTREQRKSAGGRRGTCTYTVAGHAEAVQAMFLSALADPDAPDSADDSNRVAVHRVAGGEQEQDNPAKAGLSSTRGESSSGGKPPSLPKASVPPADWMPSPTDLAFAALHAPGVDPYRFAALFVASCQAHGYRYRDHSAAFQAWLLNRWEHPHDNNRTRSPEHPTRPQRASVGARHASVGSRADRSAANRDAAFAALNLLAD
jgi:hypothetical protein